MRSKDHLFVIEDGEIRKKHSNYKRYIVIKNIKSIALLNTDEETLLSIYIILYIWVLRLNEVM